jgi:hypothetical protein
MRPIATIVLVPYWVHETMRRHNLSASADMLDFEKVKPLFSAVDLAGFISMQEELATVVGDPGGYYDGSALTTAWQQSCQQPGSREYLDYTLYPLVGDATFRQECRDRLFAPVAAKRPRDEEAFITYDVAPEVGAIVIYPGHFTSKTSGELQDRALEAILKTLYVHNALHEVARTPWFRQYLHGLSVKLAAV